MNKTSKEEPKEQRKTGETVRINLSFEPASTKDLGEGVLEAIITTNGVDRHNERIVTEGIDIDSYMKNPVVLYGHDYSSLPIGKTLSLTRMKNKIKARFQLAVDEYPFAKTVYDLIKGGYLNATSIGGLVKEWSDDFKEILKLDMAEFSVVPIPANEGAIITGRAFKELTGKTITEVRKEFEDFAHKTLVDKVSGMPDDDINQAITSLKHVLAALEDSIKAKPSAGESTEVKRVKRIRIMDNAKAVNREAQRITHSVKLKLRRAES